MCDICTRLDSLIRVNLSESVVIEIKCSEVLRLSLVVEFRNSVRDEST